MSYGLTLAHRGSSQAQQTFGTPQDGRRQHTVAEIAGAAGVHRTTVYDYLNKER